MAAMTTAQIVFASVGAAGTAMSALGAMNQAQAAKDQARYQAAIQRNNQIVAERQAADTLKRGKEAADAQREKARQLKSRQLVMLAGQGVDVSSGSSVDLLADTAELGEFDAQKIEGNAARQSHSQKIQAANFGSQAGLFQAKSDAQSPLFAGTSTLLSGVGSVAAKWYTPTTGGNAYNPTASLKYGGGSPGR